MFIDREKELSALNNFFNNNKAQFIVIYGKRRIGKTELIKQFIKNKSHIYFLAQKISEKENLKILGKLIGEYFDDLVLKTNGFENWQIFFEYLKKYIEKRVTLVIDEFPYLAESNKGISSIFQAGWDEYLKETPIYLIICGSSISLMEEQVLGYKAPLYGRRTGQIFLRPFGFYEASDFFPNLSFEKKLTYFSILGGTPSYLNKIAPENSIEENLKKNFFSTESTFYNEVDFILREELREPRNYFAILKAIAFNKTKVGEIVNESGFEKNFVIKYLSILEDLHIIQKEIPVTEKNPLKSRKGIYKLQDQFFKFWFKYILPNKSKIELGLIDTVLQDILNDLIFIISENYEKIAQEIVIKNEDKFFSMERIGRWWDKSEEIDIVALNENKNQILFGEVKWSNKPIGVNIYEELKRKAKIVPWGDKDRVEYFCLFSKSGFTEDLIKLSKMENLLLFHEDKLIN